MRSCSGQATLEYVAVVALVAAVLAAGAGAIGGRDVAGAVHAGVVRALCVVGGGGACGADVEPCPTRWRRDARSWGLRLSAVELGGGTSVLREELSDGTVALTYGQDGSGGLDGSVTLPLRVVDAQVRAAAMAAAGRGGTWVLPDARAAEAFVARIAAWRRGEGGREPDVPLADVEYAHRAPSGELGAAVVVEGAGIEASARRAVLRGTRRDRRTGRTTVYLESVVETAAGVAGTLGGRTRSARGGRRATAAGSAADVGQAATQLAVTLDAGGRPVELQLLRTDPSGAVPAEASGAAGLLRVARGERVVVVDQRLDLADPANRAAAGGVLAALRSGGRPAVGPALAARLREAAVVHVRAYELGRDDAELGGTAGTGALRLGARRGRSTEHARLVAAVTRGIGGSWGVRGECLRA